MIIDSYMENGFYTTGSVVAELADITPVDYSSCATVDEACMTAYLEMVNEYNAFETSIREAEIAFVQENGVAPVYEAASIKEMVNAAIEHVKAWAAKMYGVLDRFMKEVASKLQLARTKIFKGNKEKFDKGAWKSEWDFEDYNYTNVTTDAMKTPLINAKDISGYADEKNINDHINSILKLYGVDIDHCTTKDIREAVLGKKINVNKAYIDKIDPLGTIKDYSKGLAAVKEERKKVSKTANEIIKEIKSLIKDDTKTDEKAVYNRAIKAVGKINGMNSILITAKLSMLMGKLNQAYKICGIMYRSSGKVGSKVNDMGAKLRKKGDNDYVDKAKDAGTKVAKTLALPDHGTALATK